MAACFVAAALAMPDGGFLHDAEGKAFRPATPVPADAVPYAVTLRPTGDGDLDTAIASSSQLKALSATQAVDAYALAGRIRRDYDRVTGALESQGYYAGKVTIEVKAGTLTLDGRDPGLPGALSALAHGKNGTKAEITISAVPGRRFVLGTVTLTTPVSPNAPNLAAKDAAAKAAKAPAAASGAAALRAAPVGAPVVLNDAERRAFGLTGGQPAVAAKVLAAQDALQTELAEEGYATASVSAPLAYLHPETGTLDIVFRVARGPKVVVGPITMAGFRRTRESFLRRRLLLKEGQLYQPSKIEAARQDLAAVGIFSAVQVRDDPPIITLGSPGGPNVTRVPGVDQAMPLHFDFAEARPRTIAAEIGYSTDLGGRLGGSWTHHNLLGNAEQLKLRALVTGIGGTAQQGLGYDGYADFSKPDFLRRDQSLNLRVEAVRQLLYSYHQTALILSGGVGRHLDKYWYVSAGLSATQEQIRQFGDTRSYFIIAAPLSATFDNTELSNPIDPATHGWRASVSVTPSESLEHGSAFFTIFTAQASTYFDLARLHLTKPGASVIAVRGIVGSVQGASTYQIPPDQRLYAGGPATVRGFRYQGVGPQYGNTKYAIGGTSMDAGTVEFRQRIPRLLSGNIGVAGFADAGQVGTGSRPGEGKLRVGYGGGVRYFTPIGPVRVDVALPMNRPYRGDTWELYLGLGETF